MYKVVINFYPPYSCKEKSQEYFFFSKENAASYAQRLRSCQDVTRVQIIEDFFTGEVIYDTNDR